MTPYPRRIDDNQPAIVAALRAPITITVRMLPPTANHMWLLNRNGSRRLSDAALAFRALVAVEVLHSRPHTLPDGPLALLVALTYGRRGMGDVDNRIKAAADALALALDFDDKRIRFVQAWDAGYDKGRPLTILTLAPAVAPSVS